MSNELILIRKDDKVFHQSESGVIKELKINKQETKGPGREVVKIEGLPNTNGQKWYSLSKLQEGENVLSNLKYTEREISSSSYRLTDEERQEVKNLQSQIDEIIQNAKDRYVPTPKMPNPANLTIEERQEKLEEMKKFLGL